MAWNRMKSEEENKRESIRGFLPFIEGAFVEGALVACKTKEDGKGYAVIRTDCDITVNVRDTESKTGQGIATKGQLVGVRKTGATKRLWELEPGTVVRLTYIGAKQRETINPRTGQKETNLYHDIAIDIWEEKEAA